MENILSKITEALIRVVGGRMWEGAFNFGVALLLLSNVSPLFSASVVDTSESTQLYGTFEIEFEERSIEGNRFTEFVLVTFFKDSRIVKVDGFYDGGDTWRARFMPDEAGAWNYYWSFKGSSGVGVFECEPQPVYEQAYGHVTLDPNNKRYLKYDNNKGHFCIGSAWLHGTSYGPVSKDGEINKGNVSDEIFIDYLDTLEAFEHNEVLIKNSLYPVENDKFTWDLDWVRKGEWLVREAAKRGIYCQIGTFDTWSRDKSKWFE